MTFIINENWVVKCQFSYKLLLSANEYTWIPNKRISGDYLLTVKTYEGHHYRIFKRVYDRFGESSDVEVDYIDGNELSEYMRQFDVDDMPPEEKQLPLPITTGEPLEELIDER